MMKRVILTGSVSLLSLVAASGASAQTQGAPSDTPPAGAVQAAPSDNGQDATQDVVVTGIRAAQQASIQAKRSSTIIADIISAEDIGKFPDKNVAEALQRVPGIVINREFGEGERVSLRGTAPNLTKTLVNGHNIATADWFILDQLGATRSFNYLTLPAEIVGQLDVYKSSQADVEEGGIGGTINVHTRHPLDLPRWSINLSGQAAYSERSDKFDPQASGLISWKNDAGTFGVLVGGVYQKRRIRRDGVEILGYQNYDVAPTVLVPPPAGSPVGTPSTTAVNPAFNPALVGKQYGSLIGSALFQQERERYGGNVELQFKPTDNLEIVATGLYSRFNATNSNQNYLAWTSNALGGGGSLTNATVVDNTIVKGTVTSSGNGTTGRAVVYDTFYREAYAETWSGDLDVTYRTGSEGVLHLKGGYTRAVGQTSRQFLDEGGAPGAFTFDITGRTPQVSFTGVRPTVPNDLIYDFSNISFAGNVDKEKYGYIDFEQPVGGPISAIKVGAKYTDHDRSSALLQTTYSPFFTGLTCGGRACVSSDFAGGALPGDFLANIALPGTLRNYYNVDVTKVRDILAGQPAANQTLVINPPSNYAVNEKVYGGYAMVKVGEPQVQGLHANIGLRVVRTEQTSSGNLLGVPATTPGAVTGNAFGVYAPITVKRTYTDILPALNVWFDLSPQAILRFGAGRTIARPDYTDIVPNVNLNQGSLSGDGGDPRVNRYESDDVNLSLEFYPDRETIFAGALYYKQIASYIVNRTTQETFPIQTTTPNLSRCTPATGFVAVTNPLYNCLFDINRRSNGSGGRNFGVEVQASRRLFGPFGAIVNYTYSDAKSDAGDPIPGNSKHALNLTGYFENDWLSLRASYNYRSAFFINIDRASPLNQGKTESLDASANLKLTNWLSLTADAVNLTNTKIYQYSGTQTRFRALYDNGRIFYAGARVKF